MLNVQLARGRTELRTLEGVAALVTLLSSEHGEIVEYGVRGLLWASEDGSDVNRQPPSSLLIQRSIVLKFESVLA